MKRWILELPDDISVYCDADGWGCVMDKDGEAVEINDHEHAILFVKAHREGTESFFSDEVIELEAFEAEEGEA